MKTQSDRIAKARMNVILMAPFFGSLLMRLTMVRDDSVQTFCTDGKRIRYNEAYCAALSDGELCWILVEETCHCAQGHLWRMGPRDPKKWNHAADYQIHQMLTEYMDETRSAHGNIYWMTPVTAGSPFSPEVTGPHLSRTPPPRWTMPKDSLHDPAYTGMAVEEIYSRIDGQEAPPIPSPGEIEEPAGEEMTNDGMTNDEKMKGNGSNARGGGGSTEEDWKIAVAQAAAVAKMRGEFPGSVARLVGELLAPKVSWRQVLREFIRARARDDYSWARPNPRYLSTGFILPSIYNERMGRLAIAVDTSGSIDERTLAEFGAEIQAALDECAPEVLEVIYCDARVRGVEEFRPGDLVKLEPKGGGGTRFEPVFEHLDESGEPPVALVYLTDGFGSFPEREPEYPVLWATTEREEFPFGEVVALAN